MNIEQWINEEYGADAPPPNLIIMHPATYEKHREEVQLIVDGLHCAVSLNKHLDKETVYMGRVE